MRAQPEPEPEVAEIHPAEQEPLIDVRTGRHEASEQAFERDPRRRMALGQA